MKKQTVIIRDEATRKNVLSVLSQISLEKPVKVEWETYRKKRTLSQNALYHALVARFAEETGYTHDEMHEVFKQMFVPPKIIELNGKSYELRSTANKNTAEMAAITEQIYALGAQMGIYLPVPEEMHL